MWAISINAGNVLEHVAKDLTDRSWPTLLSAVGAVRRTIHELSSEKVGIIGRSYKISSTFINTVTGQRIDILFHRPMFLNGIKPKVPRCGIIVGHDGIRRNVFNTELYYTKGDAKLHLVVSRAVPYIHFGRKSLRLLQENVDSGVFRVFDLDTSIKLVNSGYCLKFSEAMDVYALIHLGRQAYLLKKTFNKEGRTWTTMAVDDESPLSLMVSTNFSANMGLDCDRYLTFLRLHVPEAEEFATPVSITTVEGDRAFVDFVIDNGIQWTIMYPSTPLLSFAFIDPNMATLFETGYNT